VRRPVQGAGGDGVKALVEAKGLVQISDPAALQAIIDKVLAANPAQLEQYRAGKTKLQGFFVGCARLRPCLFGGGGEWGGRVFVTIHASGGLTVMMGSGRRCVSAECSSRRHSALCGLTRMFLLWH